MEKQRSGAGLLIECLTLQKVEHIFAIPGAKIDRVFNELVDGGPDLIVCRHEQNAAFMAAAVGRLTGRPGVCLVTSGPGTSNLATGLVTANTEGDPVVAIGGMVGKNDDLKKTHQSMPAIELLKPITKYCVAAELPENVAEITNNAFRIASSPRMGATFIGLPADVQAGTTTAAPLAVPAPVSGGAKIESIHAAAEKINSARLPVMIIGMDATRPEATAAIRKLIARFKLPVVATYQGAGVISRTLISSFAGRIGLFRNQPGDILMSKADLIIAVGYDPVEYDPRLWNIDIHVGIIHISDTMADIDNNYQPAIELTGNISATIDSLGDLLDSRDVGLFPEATPILSDYAKDLIKPPKSSGNLVHPLQFIQILRNLIGDDVTVTCDMGSHYIWMARHFLSYEPKRLLFSNGQQTLGVGLPWGMAACLVHPSEKVVSISGDGGFLFSSMELETAVRLKLNLVHFIWRDGTYNMVAFQEQMKYGRMSGVEFGRIDTVKHAESYGAVGLRVDSPHDLEKIMKRALEIAGPVVVEIPIDYSENVSLGKTMQPDLFH